MPKKNTTQIPKIKSMKNPSRKIRSRTRKPKFLSLLLLDSSPESSHLAGNKMTHQLNLFPLHPENTQIEEKDLTYLFTSDPPLNLTGILKSGEDDCARENISSEENSVFSKSLTCAYGGMDSEESISLVRTAMRSRERERSEEKWVCYSEVVEERKKVEEEVTSCCFTADEREKGGGGGTECLLSLKLDYDEILNAWSDKGSLYVEGLGGSQIVPAFDNHQNFGFDSVLLDGLWSVPEKAKSMPIMDEELTDEELKITQREASVLRYKEKRQSRLFSKRIRYEVRKVNAEKRPRMKGRFVKRS